MTVALGEAQRLVLAYLADQGPIDTDAGGAIHALADALGLGVSHAGNLVKRLCELDLVETRADGRRTFHVGISHEGRRSIDREASWHRRERRGRMLAEQVAVAPPVMPMAGAIGPLGRFCPEAAREAAARASVL